MPLQIVRTAPFLFGHPDDLVEATMLPPDHHGCGLGCNRFTGTLAAVEEHEHGVLMLLNIVVPLQHPLSVMQEARRHALARQAVLRRRHAYGPSAASLVERTAALERIILVRSQVRRGLELEEKEASVQTVYALKGEKLRALREDLEHERAARHGEGCAQQGGRGEESDGTTSGETTSTARGY